MTNVYQPLPTKARKDPLGPVYLSALKSNMGWMRSLMQVEHMTSGEHNTRRVPRACVSIIWSGATYSISPSSSDVTAVANPAVGTITLTLAANRFTTDIRPQINFKGTGVATKPWMTGFKVTSATSVTVFLKQLSSALGAGNAWAAADGSFDIALHSDPLNVGTWSTTQANHFRGDTLTDGGTDWNALVQSHGDMQASLKAAHTAAGAHNVREVAKAYGNVLWGGASYSLAGSPGHSSNVSGVSRTSAGIIVVTFSSMTTPTQCFPCPDYGRTIGGDPGLYKVQAAQTSATTSTVYIYKYDTVGKTWNVADADFFFALHGG